MMIEKKVLLFLQRYFFHNEGDGLIVDGNDVSFLANPYSFYELDLPLEEICEEYGITHTRYMDDLIFSFSKPIGKKRKGRK